MVRRALLHAISLVLAVAAVFCDIQPGYLDFDNLPETNFSCEGKVIGGYYADVETGCQMFHVCTIGQKGEVSDIKFLCLNGTVFDQETRVCERIDEVDCDKSEDFFNLNLELYGNTPNFGVPEEEEEGCNNDDCEEQEDSEYDDDVESTTILTTTTTTTTPKPTSTTQRTTQRTTQSYTQRYTTQQPDSLQALLALHNAFNQGLNRRPVLNPIAPTPHHQPTRLPSYTTSTSRRPNIAIATLRTHFGTPEHQRNDYSLRRPTFQPTYQPSYPTFSPSSTSLKSNYHTFESSDTHFGHSFDPDKPYHFQYFSQKSTPSPFVRREPDVQVVTSTSTSTSIKIANTTVDSPNFDDYDNLESFFHDVPKITRPKRSTTRSSSSRAIKTSSAYNLQEPHRSQKPAKVQQTGKTRSDPSSTTVSQMSTSIDVVQGFESLKTSPLPHPEHKKIEITTPTSTKKFYNRKPTDLQREPQFKVSTKPHKLEEILEINASQIPNLDPVDSDSFESKMESVFIKNSSVQTPAGFSRLNSKPENKKHFDHVIKIDPEDILLSKNYTNEEPEEHKENYLNNLLDSIAMEDNDKNRVVKLLKKSEPEMEHLIDSKGVDMMLETLENKLLEMELEGRGRGIPFEYEGDSFEIREKRGSDDKSVVGNEENDEEVELECKNPIFCVKPTEDVVQVDIEDGNRQKRSTRVRTRIRAEEKIKDDETYTTETARTTRKSRRKVTRTRVIVEDSEQDEEEVPQPWDAAKVASKKVPPKEEAAKANPKKPYDPKEDERVKIATKGNQQVKVKTISPTSTNEPEYKPVTEEIEGDFTTAEYRRPPPNGKLGRRNYFVELTTPYAIVSSTRLQTRFDYENQKFSITTRQTTEKPNYYRYLPVVPVHEVGDEKEQNGSDGSKRYKRDSLTEERFEVNRSRGSRQRTNGQLQSTRRSKSQSNYEQPEIRHSEYSDNIEQSDISESGNSELPTDFLRYQAKRRDGQPVVRTKTKVRQQASLDENEERSLNPPRRRLPSRTQSITETPSIRTRQRTTVKPIAQNIDDLNVFDSVSALRQRSSTDQVSQPVEFDISHLKQTEPRVILAPSTQKQRVRTQHVSEFDQNDNYETTSSKKSANNQRTHSTRNNEFSQSTNGNDNIRNQHTGLRTQSNARRKVVRQRIHSDSAPPPARPEVIVTPNISPVREFSNERSHVANSNKNVKRPSSGTNNNFRSSPSPGYGFSPMANLDYPSVVSRYSDDKIIVQPDTTSSTSNFKHLGSSANFKLENSFGSLANSDNYTPEVSLDVEKTTTVPPTPYSPGHGVEADPSFSCRGKIKGGLYADVYSDCHGFFICSQAKRGIVPTHFWCGVGTKFNQKSRICQESSLVDCSTATKYYYLNDNTYIPTIDLEEKLRGDFEPMKQRK